MNYLSVRAMIAGVIALLITLIFGKRFIGWLDRIIPKEDARDLENNGQSKKQTVPSMGGILILISLLVPVLLFCDLTSTYIQLLVFTAIWCSGIGFIDDYIKTFRHNKDGLSPKGKLGLQIILGLVVGITVWSSPNIVVREKTEISVTENAGLDLNTEMKVTDGQWKDEDVVKSTKTTIPFVKSHEFDYKFLSPFNGKWGWYAKWGIYVLMIVIVITACSNGANLTDGIDGLAAGTSAIVGVVVGILAWLSGNLINSNYLNIMYIPGAGEIAIFMAAFVGALIGFLWFNATPAQMYMGDTGSLAIGGIIGVGAVLIRKELLLPLLCGIFFVESLSVMMQTAYFRRTKKKYGQGRRIFSMTPIHEHYTRKGNPAIFSGPEPPIAKEKLAARFWIVELLLAVATLALLKIR